MRFRRIVEVPEELPEQFILWRHGKPDEKSRRERYYYIPQTRRNLKLITDKPLEELVGKVAITVISWDDNKLRPEEAPKLFGRAKEAGGLWRLYLYQIDRRPDGSPATSSQTIKISFDLSPAVQDDLLALYRTFPLYAEGMVAIGPKKVTTPEKRVLSLVNELKRKTVKPEIDPIRLLEIERAIRALEL